MACTAARTTAKRMLRRAHSPAHRDFERLHALPQPLPPVEAADVARDGRAHHLQGHARRRPSARACHRTSFLARAAAARTRSGRATSACARAAPPAAAERHASAHRPCGACVCAAARTCRVRARTNCKSQPPPSASELSPKGASSSTGVRASKRAGDPAGGACSSAAVGAASGDLDTLACKTVRRAPWHGQWRAAHLGMRSCAKRGRSGAVAESARGHDLWWACRKCG